MNRLPDISPETSPLTLVELIYSTAIRDVMTPEPITVTRGTRMSAVQQIMRERGVSGVPVAEEGRLFGIVSIHDLIEILRQGKLETLVSECMTERVVTLEEEMPLSLAISTFSKYPYGRFPVLNAAQRLTGIITVRDINVTLVTRLMQQVSKFESMLDSEVTPGLEMNRVFQTRRHDFENGGKASTTIKKHLVDHHVNRTLVKRVAIASYELEMNQVVHSIGGTISYRITPQSVEILVQDRGPGIENVEQALQEGYTTADDWIKSLGFGAGLGLPNAKRVSDVFFIHSAPGVGTTVKSVIYLQENKQKEEPHETEPNR
jgi:CBS domain-containing protein/anti-sigma regulatory factor (Ser/Thr protein kinase)